MLEILFLYFYTSQIYQMKYLYPLCLLLVSITSFSQSHFLIEIPFSNQVDEAAVIAEGKVIANKAYWDINQHNIYTVHTIDVSKSN